MSDRPAAPGEASEPGALAAVTRVRGAPLPAGQIHAADFVRPYFNKALDWWHRHRKEVEEGFGFPRPIPPALALVYYIDEIEAWRKGRCERARRGVEERHAHGLAGGAVTVHWPRTAFGESPAGGLGTDSAPNWDTLKQGRPL